MKKYIIIIIILYKSTTGIAQKAISTPELQKLPAVLERKEAYTTILYPQNAYQVSQVKQFSSDNKKVIRICSPSRHSLEDSPLFILDGIEVPKGDSLRIAPNDIQSLEVLNDKKTLEIYGEKGKNGVILIRSKKK